MACTEMRPAIIVTISLMALFGLCEGQCSRDPPDSTDCSAAEGVCSILYNNRGRIISTVPFPEQNTRSCFRTCFDSTESCRVTRTKVRNEEIQIDAGRDSSLYTERRIFSPGYDGTSNYLGSSICRYRVDCDEGEILSYSIHTLNLEGNGSCDGGDQCLDFLKIDMPGRGDPEIRCGNQNFDNMFFLDGQSSMDVEFASNRENEMPGFELVVTCALPSFTTPRLVDGDGDKKRAAKKFEYSNCTFPPHDDKLKYGEIKELEQEAVTTLISWNADFTIVQMNEIVGYSYSTVVLYDKGNPLKTIRDISTFHFISRLRRLKFHGQAPQNYSGYGILLNSSNIAYFYQLGASPALQPTPEEARIAFELQRGVTDALGNQDRYDVDDVLDILERFPTCFDLPKYPKYPSPKIPWKKYPHSYPQPINQPHTSTPPNNHPPHSQPPSHQSPVPSYPQSPLPSYPQSPMPSYPQSPMPSYPEKMPMQQLANTQSYHNFPTYKSGLFHPHMPGLYRQGRSIPTSPYSARQCFRNPKLDKMALRYGNACNGVLRAAACSYQEQLLRRDCITGERLFPFV